MIKNVTAKFAIAVLSGWALLALAAPLLAPSTEQQTRLESTDVRSISLLPPFSRGFLQPHTTTPDRWVFERRGDNPPDAASAVVKAPINFWLGTDRIGNDLALSIARGARTSMVIGLCAALFAVTIGIGIGVGAGLSSKIVDSLLMRFLDAMLAFPLLLLVLMLDLLFDPGLIALVLLLGAVQWMGIARIVRAEMMRLRNAPFVVAARAMGQHGPALVLRHLLPNALQPIALSGMLLVGDSILLESGLAFLGFGTATDLESWGRLVDQGRPYLLSAWWVSALPGLAIVLVVTALNLLGERHLGTRSSNSTRGVTRLHASTPESST